MRLKISVLLGLMALCPLYASAQTRYGIMDLGKLNTREGGVMAINDHGEVVGGDGHGFLWTGRDRIDLGTLPPVSVEDYTTEIAYGINNREQIVGTSGSFGPIFMSGLQFARGVLIENRAARQFTEHNSSFIPYAINDRGEIVGLNAYRGFFYANGTLIPLETLSHLPNGNLSTARSLNQQGQVVGWSTVGSEPERKFGPLATHAFLWQRHGKSGKMRDLGTLPGWINSYACGINRRGEIIGSVSDATGGPHGIDTDKTDTDGRAAAFLWRNDKMTSIGTLAGSKNSVACGINDSTAIVGTSDNRAFLWKRGKMLDLNAFLPSGSGWTLEEAGAINNKGQIVGSGKLNGQEHLFLLTPINTR
jgi:probable HAF family extracellular repeat protein